MTHTLIRFPRLKRAHTTRYTTTVRRSRRRSRPHARKHAPCGSALDDEKRICLGLAGRERVDGRGRWRVDLRAAMSSSLLGPVRRRLLVGHFARMQTTGQNTACESHTGERGRRGESACGWHLCASDRARREGSRCAHRKSRLVSLSPPCFVDARATHLAFF